MRSEGPYSNFNFLLFLLLFSSVGCFFFCALLYYIQEQKICTGGALFYWNQGGLSLLKGTKKSQSAHTRKA